MIHAQCDTCGAFAITDNHADPDSEVRCRSGADDPAGSVDGSCCTAGHTHEEHAEHARTTHDASCRTITITIMPGPGAVQVGAGGGQPAYGSQN
jgi:hypothetical protein